MTKEGRRKLFESDPKRFAIYGEEFKDEKKPEPIEEPKEEVVPKPKLKKKKGRK